MAILLAMYQKMKLIREKNQLTYEVAGYTNKISRIQKNIAKVQKMYAARIKNLENAAKYQIMGYKNLMSMQFNSTSLFATAMNSLVGNNATNKSIWEAYQKGNFNPNDKGEYYIDGRSNPLTSEEIQGFNSLFSTAQMNANQQQTMLNTNIQNNEMFINAQLEEEKQRLEDEQEMAKEALEYEETMMEMDKATAETRLNTIEGEIQSYDQLLTNETKNAAPKFGLS